MPCLRRSGKRPTVGSFLLDHLYGRGVHHAFGIPGDYALPLFWWLERSKIDLINMTHEPCVGFAADGYARLRGLGLACVTYCVGGLNMLNSIAGAYAEKSPVLVVSGGPSAAERRDDPLLHHKVKTFDTQRRIYEEVTCANTILLDPETAADEIVRVVDAVVAHAGPATSRFPTTSSMSRSARRTLASPLGRRLTPTASTNACGRRSTASIGRKQPVILAGVELHRHKLTDLALGLAEKFNIPVAADLLSKSVIQETHPLYIGVYSGALSEPACRKYVDGSDCVLMLGTFITDMFLGVNTARISRQRSILSTTERTRVGLHYYDGVPFADFLRGLRAGEDPPPPEIPESQPRPRTQAAAAVRATGPADRRGRVPHHRPSRG